MRRIDNVVIERLWRSQKYECVYLQAWETGSSAKAGISQWMTFHNHHRPHTSLGGTPPAVFHRRYIAKTQPEQQVQKKVAQVTPETVQAMGSSSVGSSGRAGVSASVRTFCLQQSGVGLMS